MSWLTRSALPVAVVLAAIVALWYAGSVVMNISWEVDQAKRAGIEVGEPAPDGFTDTWFPRFSRVILNPDLVPGTMTQERPVLPTPGQVWHEIWNTSFGILADCEVETTEEGWELSSACGRFFTSKRSLVYHAGVTLSATLLGFGMGIVLGILIAVGITHNRAMDMSVMPWVIASQTIPILAVAPMIIVVLNAVGLQGLIPKAMISMYLSFFPVVVGMVKGLRSPDALQLDQMRTWNASRWQVFWKLRWPASMPFLFASMKVAIAISLVGAIVGELPTGARAGIGARLLVGDQFGDILKTWGALIFAAFMGAALVALVGLAQRIVLRRSGGASA